MGRCVFRAMSFLVRPVAAVAAMLLLATAAMGQVGLASQSRQIVVAHPDGTSQQSAPTFGVWNSLVIVGNTAGDENSVDAQSDVSESSIRMSANVTTRQGGNVTSTNPVSVIVSVHFNLFSESIVNIAASDTMGIFASGLFTLNGPDVAISSRNVSQMRVLGPGSYTLTYTFTKLGSTLPASGSFLFALDFTGFQPGPTAVTYQGKLNDAGGQPANGEYDFGFTVYDESTGGSPLQFGIARTNVPVVNGVFTTEFDFGSPIWQSKSNRWLEVAVRPSNSSDPSTVLTPRQRIGPTPRAIYADTTGTAILAETALGLDATSRVQIRGDSGASSNSPGVILASPLISPIARGFVGMADDDNLGLYGYEGAGWGLTLRTDTGRVGIGTLNPNAMLEVTGAVRATSYQYPTQQTRSIMVGYAEFRCQGTATPAINNVSFGVAGPDGTSTPLLANVRVPEDSQILDMTFFYRDNSPSGNLRVSAFVYNMDVPNLSNLFPTTDLVDFQATPINRTISVSGGSATTSTTQILIQIFPVDGEWNSFNTLTVQGVRVRYSVNGPQ